MDGTSQPAARLDFIELLKIIVRWKKQLIITGIIAALTAFIFTRPFFIPPQFKSTAIVYPSNITPYSTESPTETLLQFLQSVEVQNMLIKKTGLYDYYKIDPSSQLAHAYMFEKLGERIRISRTQYESVEITVWDESPKMAAVICDSLVSSVNEVIRNIQKIKSSEVVVINKNLMDEKKADMDSLENQLKQLRLNYGILDFVSQSKEIARAVYRDGNKQSPAVSEQYKNLKEHGGEEFALTEHLFRARGFYNDAKRDYERSLADYEKILTYSNLVTRPLPAEIKDFPKGTLIILGFTASVLFFALIIIVLIESWRSHLKKQLTS